MAEATWPSAVVCSGDSGGGMFLGDGRLAGVNATRDTVDRFGDVVDHKFEIEEMIRQIDGNFEFGVDRPGNDYQSSAASDASGCKSLCESDQRCKAFSFQKSQKRCWLKSGVMALVFNDNNTSGLPNDVLPGRDSVGHDIKSFLSKDVLACGSACSTQTEPRCVAYAVNASTGRCYLKSAVGIVSSNKNVTLGFIRSPETDTDRNGGDYFNFPSNSPDECASRCAKDGRCQAWTVNQGRCWLKEFPRDATQSPGAVSGFRRGLEFFLDYRGSDLSQFVLPGVADDSRPLLRAQYCQAACDGNPACKAWTVDRTTSICYLKSDIPQRVDSPGSITGRKGTALRW